MLTIIGVHVLHGLLKAWSPRKVMQMVRADKLNEQSPILLQGDATEKAIYLGVDPDGNRIFMAKPGMRLVVLDEPPADLPHLLHPFEVSLVDGGASLLEALRTAQVSPLFSHKESQPSVTDGNEESTRNVSKLAAPSGKPFPQWSMFCFPCVLGCHVKCTQIYTTNLI